MPGFATNREVFLALHGQDSKVDISVYQLAELLHKLPAEIRAMPYSDYIELCAYVEVNSEIQRVRRGGVKGG